MATGHACALGEAVDLHTESNACPASTRTELPWPRWAPWSLLAPISAASLLLLLAPGAGSAAGPGLIAEDLPEALRGVLRDLHDGDLHDGSA